MSDLGPKLTFTSSGANFGFVPVADIHRGTPVAALYSNEGGKLLRGQPGCHRLCARKGYDLLASFSKPCQSSGGGARRWRAQRSAEQDGHCVVGVCNGYALERRPRGVELAAKYICIADWSNARVASLASRRSGVLRRPSPRRDRRRRILALDRHAVDHADRIALRLRQTAEGVFAYEKPCSIELRELFYPRGQVDGVADDRTLDAVVRAPTVPRTTGPC